MNEIKIDIVNLIDEPQYIEEVSKWIWKEWSQSKGLKLEDVIYRTKHSLNSKGIPTMYIAKIQDVVVGVVSIWVNDLTSRQDLSPWMATLYVDEKYRNLGIGKILQRKCITEAKNLNYDYLYLITEHDNYYEKTGWEFMEIAPLDDGKYERIYRYNLINN